MTSLLPVADAPPLESAQEYAGMPSIAELIFHIHPTVSGAIANAFHEPRYIFLGDTDKQRAALLSRIASSIGRVAPETIRRAFNNVEACRKALICLDAVANHLKEIIKKYESESSR